MRVFLRPLPEVSPPDAGPRCRAESLDRDDGMLAGLLPSEGTTLPRRFA